MELTLLFDSWNDVLGEFFVRAHFVILGRNTEVVLLQQYIKIKIGEQTILRQQIIDRICKMYLFIGRVIDTLFVR
jgi:hypothetical protein